MSFYIFFLPPREYIFPFRPSLGPRSVSRSSIVYIDSFLIECVKVLVWAARVQAKFRLRPVTMSGVPSQEDITVNLSIFFNARGKGCGWKGDARLDRGAKTDLTNTTRGIRGEIRGGGGGANPCYPIPPRLMVSPDGRRGRKGVCPPVRPSHHTKETVFPAGASRQSERNKHVLCVVMDPRRRAHAI